MVFEYLQKRSMALKSFVDKIRLVGLRSKEQFQGAVANFWL